MTEVSPDRSEPERRPDRGANAVDPNPSEPNPSEPNPSEPNPSEVVSLTIPANTRHVATARVVAASMAADMGFDVDEIDDLRLGVNEAVALLLDSRARRASDTTAAPAGGADSLEVRLAVDGPRLEIEVTDPDAPPVELDELAHRILSAVVNDHSARDGRIRLTKSRLHTAPPDAG